MVHTDRRTLINVIIIGIEDKLTLSCGEHVTVLASSAR